VFTCASTATAVCSVFIPLASTPPLHVRILLSSAPKPVKYGIYPHYYTSPPQKATFSDALRLASEATFAGANGHLFTPNSYRDMLNIITSTTIREMAWVGFTDQAIEGTWVFAAGPHAGENITDLLWWEPSEPDGAATQNCAMYWYGQGLLGNDACSNKLRFIIEFECPSGQQFNSAGTACVGMMPDASCCSFSIICSVMHRLSLDL
jgi:hypothetical protein